MPATSGPLHCTASCPLLMNMHKEVAVGHGHGGLGEYITIGSS